MSTIVANNTPVSLGNQATLDSAATLKGDGLKSDSQGGDTHFAALKPEHGGYADEEFSYRPVPTQVSIAAGLVLLGMGSFLTEWLLILPLLGVVFAWLASRTIANSDGAYSGLKAARSVMVAAVVIIVSASSMHAYAYATEVPEGYQRVSFASDISQHGMKVVDGQVELPAQVQELQDKPIFVKGYMYPTKQMAGITSFLLCKDSGDCCFGGTPKPTDMILVTMPKEKAVNFAAGLTAVAGKFTLANGAQADGQSPVYKIDGELFFSPARTAY